MYLNQKNYSRLIEEQQKNIHQVTPKKIEEAGTLDSQQDRLNKRIKVDQRARLNKNGS